MSKQLDDCYRARDTDYIALRMVKLHFECNMVNPYSACNFVSENAICWSCLLHIFAYIID